VTDRENRDNENSVDSAQLHDTHPYHQPVDLPFVLPTRLYTGMLVVWLLRPALQQRFPLQHNNPETYLRFLAWCAYLGRRQYSVLRDIEEWNHELMQPVEMPYLKKCAWQKSYTVGMYLAGFSRSKYWHSQIMGNVKMRHRAARWYFREGRQMTGLDDCPAWQLAALQQAFGDIDSFTQQLILPKDAQLAGGEQRILSNVADITAQWQNKPSEPNEPLNKHQQKVAPYKVSRLQNTARLASVLPIEANEISWLINEVKRHLPTNKPNQSQITKLMAPLPKPIKAEKKHITKPFGVNLVGYARGELGIGEDVRMLAAALQKAQIPFNIINVEPGANVSQRDTSAEKWLSEKFDYAISIFCMTGIEMTRMTLEKGLEWLEGHYNIGLWPWELPEWPKAWHHALNLVDELWGISRYTADAYSEAAGSLPVLPMPLPVSIDAENVQADRQKWNLPEDAYLFVFSFDMNSTLARKNPIATVEAFLDAFADQPNKRVGLVIKVSHLNTKHSAWKALAKLITKDKRIQLISGELRKSEVLSLYKSCDCFVSLHRAEGFGRGLAEAKRLGLALITTRFSGNMEYCTDENTYLVDYKLVPVRADEYFYGEGQQWAEPDKQQAAKLMYKCVLDSQNSDTHPDEDLRKFGLDYCGAIYRDRLSTIMETSVHEARHS